MRAYLAITGCSIAVAGLIVLVVMRIQPAGSHREPPRFQPPEQPSQPPPQLEQPPQLPPQPQPLPQPARPNVEITQIPGGTRALRQQFTAEQLQLLEMLNRADLRHLGRLQELVVPSDWTVADLAYSPLPESYPAAAQRPKLLAVDLTNQVFGAYEYGHLVRWGPISSGSQDAPTPEGLFHLAWKAKLRYSSVDADWRLPWCFNFGPRRGLDFHAYALPGHPASHACVRLLARDAKWLYEWGEQWKVARKSRRVLEPGTPVLIFGHYDYDAPPPWRSTEWLAQRTELPGLT